MNKTAYVKECIKFPYLEGKILEVVHDKGKQVVCKLPDYEGTFITLETKNCIINTKID